MITNDEFLSSYEFMCGIADQTISFLFSPMSVYYPRLLLGSFGHVGWVYNIRKKIHRKESLPCAFLFLVLGAMSVACLALLQRLLVLLLLAEILFCCVVNCCCSNTPRCLLFHLNVLLLILRLLVDHSSC